MRYEMSDERVDGAQDMVINIDQAADGGAHCWGAAVITNDRGTWECSAYTATIARDGLEHFIWAVYEGTAAYSGLTYHMQAHFAAHPGESSPLDGSFAVTGWIQAAR